MKNLDIYEYLKQKDMTPIIKNSLPPTPQRNDGVSLSIDTLTLKKYITGDITNLIIPYAENYAVYAFSGITQLKRVKIPDSFSDLYFLMVNNEKLEVVDIGKGVQHVGHNIFSYCYNLKAVIFRSVTPPNFEGLTYGADAFSSTSFDSSNDGFIYVPDQSVQSYKDVLGTAGAGYDDRVKLLSELPDEYNIKW